MKPRPGGRIHK